MKSQLSQEQVWEKIAIKWQKFKIIPAEEVIEFLESKKGRILDLGCGSGRNFIKNKGIIYGTDFSEEMIKYAKIRARKLGVKVELKKAPAGKIPYKADFFDSVICTAVLHCIKGERKRKKTLKELFRVLKPGGEALIMVWSKKQRVLKNKPKECFINWTVREKKYPRYTYIYSKKELIDLLKKAGFKILKIWENINIVVIVKKP